MPDDYSPTLRDVARRLVQTGQHVERLGNLTRGLQARVKSVPRKAPPDTRIDRTPNGTMRIDGVTVAKWVGEQVIWARNHGWTGHVTSGVRTVAEQRVACRNLCGNPNGCPGRCAKPGTSNHQGTRYPQGAVDVTEYVQFGRIVAGYPHGHHLRNDLPDDRVHFSADGH